MIDRCVQKNPKRDTVLIFEGAEGEGKCQPKGSRVLMASGEWKNIEEIKEGDLVISPQKNGSNVFAKVTELSNWFCNETYDVIQLNKIKKKLYSCSNNHLIPINVKVNPREKLTESEKLLDRQEMFDLFKNKKRIKGNWQIKNYEASSYFKLSNRTKKNMTSLSSFGVDKFLNRDNCKIEPYSLGVYLGDGSFSSLKKGSKVSRGLNITNSEYKILEEVSKYYPIMGVSKTDGRNTTNYRFTLKGELSKLLTEYSLEGKGSGEKFIPKDAMLSDKNYRKRLLAGLIDTDGYYNHGGYQFTLKSKELIENIKDLTYSLGGRTGEIREVVKSIKSINFKGTYYSITLYLHNLNLPLINEYKIKKTPSFYLSSNRLSIDVVKSKPSMVYGFSLDSPSKWYITDNWMVTHNTTYSIAVGYYVAWKTGREFDDTHVFSDLRELIDYAKNNEEKIIIWDEPALQGLSKDALTTIVKNLDRFLLMGRNKRHFIMVNMAYFNKFSEYVVWQRPSGMIHVYSRNNLEPGRFVYIRKNNLEYLWGDWRSKHKRNYRKWCSKSIRGTFPDVLNPDYKNNVLSHFNFNAYERRKNIAIMKIGVKDKREEKSELDKLKYKVSQLPNKVKVAKALGVTKRTLQRWAAKDIIDDENEQIAKEMRV